MSTDDALPGVPDLADPRPSTPVTAEFETGTANDPEVGTDEGPTTVTVDGEPVTLPGGSTLIDAMEALDDDIVSVDPGADGVAEDADVPALCYYGRGGDCSDEIGPRSECRTCMVETDQHGVVPASEAPSASVRTVMPSSAGKLQAGTTPCWSVSTIQVRHSLRGPMSWRP